MKAIQRSHCEITWTERSMPSYPAFIPWTRTRNICKSKRRSIFLNIRWAADKNATLLHELVEKGEWNQIRTALYSPQVSGSWMYHGLSYQGLSEQKLMVKIKLCSQGPSGLEVLQGQLNARGTPFLLLLLSRISQKLTSVLCVSSTPFCLGIFPTEIHMSCSSRNLYM
jgi:hypothetical protein